MMKLSRRVSLPIFVLAFAFVAAGGMVVSRKDVAKTVAEVPAPVVHVMIAEPQDVQLTVEARGTVAPRTESSLVAEVSGRIVWVSPNLVVGGFLEPNDTLIRIDPRDYEIAVVQAEAALAKAQSELKLAHTSFDRHTKMRDSGVESTAVLDTAESSARVAETIVRGAEARLEQARRDLERTHIRAPFAGRVREKHADVGQYVGRGGPIARLYAVDYAEVRLPIPDFEAAFVDLPIAYRGSQDAPTTKHPQVVLRARFAGQDHAWRGEIVRTEGELDPRTRMIHAVVRVEDPYGRGDDPNRPPLSVGLFVQAEILGNTVEDTFVIPRDALSIDDRVVVVGAEDRIELRKIEVIKRNRNTVVVASGLAAGERICLTPLAVTIEGMAVSVIDTPAVQAAKPDDSAPRVREIAGYRSIQ
jgi:RND family efflux transporter MFP subunit